MNAAPPLALLCLLATPSSGAQTPRPSPSPSPTPNPSPRPLILESVQHAVDRLLPGDSACDDAEHEGVPCFPARVEKQAPAYSVRESLRHIDPRGPRAPGPPTVPEMLGSFGRHAGGVSFDPGCAGKKAWKLLTGRNDVYYLYRFVGASGPKVSLYEQPIDPQAYAKMPGVSYELLGRYTGECEALAAYRAALRALTPVPTPSPEPKAGDTAAGDPR